MAVLNPEHLLEQAARFAGHPSPERARQADLRRAISSSYYAVFHFLLTEAADLHVGVKNRSFPRYALVYRSVDHKALEKLCSEAKKDQLPAKFAKYVPASGLGPDIRAFASVVLDLQQKRQLADYDPLYSASTSEVHLAVEAARSAIERFRNAPLSQRKAFLALLLFSPR
jgi:hypothetical protein